MIPPRKFVRLSAVLLSAMLVLTACESSEERAQKHFESGMELLQQGDVSRALVEFRNVFKLNPQHKEARLVFARTQLENGARAGAYAQYLRLVEQYPDTIEARIELAEMAVEAQNWEEAERHGRAAQELDPDNPRVKVIGLALDYAKAVRDKNLPEIEKQAEKAETVLEEQPESLIARRIVLDADLRKQNFAAALSTINAGLAFHPENYSLNSTKLQIQLRQKDMDGVGVTLKSMVDLYPENDEIRKLMIAWFLDRKDLKGAEVFLRDLASAPDADETAKMTIVRFLLETSGPDAARAELENLIASEENAISYRALLASLDFESGNKDKAVAALETLVGEGEPSEDRTQAKVVLARMLAQMGNKVGARSRVEEAIEEDSSNVDALKMRAAWLIEEDKPDQAVLDLRTALTQNPRDAAIMTLMGLAHERAGDRALAGERYALAVEVSLQAPAESLRYAEFLVTDGRIEAAKAVLSEALEKAPANLDLLQSIAALHLRTEDWSEATRVVWKLRAMEDDRANAIANGIEADLLLRQDRVDETVSFLEGLVNEGSDQSLAALSALIQTHVRSGQIDKAVDLVEKSLAENPSDLAMRYTRAGLHMIQNERAEAEKIYRELIALAPGNRRVLLVLNSLLVADGRADEAAALVDEQIEKAPDATTALQIKAERLEKERDYDGAIAIYEKLYERDSNNVAVANNLASMITTYRDDPESLDRAFAVARRLKSSNIPALQDTYGWIEYRRGNFKEALTYLEPAGKGMPEHPLVQYHLGMAYKALSRNDDAKKVLTRALELAKDDPLPQYEKAREALKELETQ